MGDTIRYPNMGTVKKAAEIYGLSPVYIRPSGRHKIFNVSCPCVHRLGHARALLGLVDALGVDGFGLCAVPCSVQALGKSGLAFPVQLPCLVHTHPMAQGGTPWHQMQRDSALFPLGVRIPIHQCCIPAHSRPHLPLLKYSPLHGLMQAHRERHTSTRRKRGALLEQYNLLPEHGHRKTGR